MLLVHEKYQSSFDVAMKCAVECEHCAEACMGNPDMLKCARTCPRENLDKVGQASLV